MPRCDGSVKHSYRSSPRRFSFLVLLDLPCYKHLAVRQHVISRLLCVALTLVLASASIAGSRQSRSVDWASGLHPDGATGSRGLTPRPTAEKGHCHPASIPFAYAAVLASAPTTTATQAGGIDQHVVPHPTPPAPSATAGECAGSGHDDHLTHDPQDLPGLSRLATVFAMPSVTEIDAYGDSMLVGSLPAMRYYFPGIPAGRQSTDTGAMAWPP